MTAEVAIRMALTLLEEAGTDLTARIDATRTSGGQIKLGHATQYAEAADARTAVLDAAHLLRAVAHR